MGLTNRCICCVQAARERKQQPCNQLRREPQRCGIACPSPAPP